MAPLEPIMFPTSGDSGRQVMAEPVKVLEG